jgi:iron(III) transport system substrate-binding protein
MSHTPAAVLGALLVCAALVLSACGGGSGADGITVYNGQHEQTTAALVALFERLTGIKVSVRSGDEAALGNQVLQEGASSPADVFYSENTPVLETLREHGMLAPVSPATLAQVPSHFNSPLCD